MTGPRGAPATGGHRTRPAPEALLILALLALWALMLPALYAWIALTTGGVVTGADGTYTLDQFQYLAWIRDSGEHLAAGNRFDLPPGARVYVHPMWLASGLLWRAGLPIEYTLLPWKAAAVLALWWGVAAYAKRFFADRVARFAAMALCLFYISPLVLLRGLAGPLEWPLFFYTFELLTSYGLWGYAPSAIATAFMPAALLAAERALVAPAGSGRDLAIAALLGLLMSWLHPWQGITVGAVIGVLVIAHRRTGRVGGLLAVGAATALPLLGYLALALLDDGWSRARASIHTPGTDLAALGVVLLPLLALAALGVRRPGADVGERVLLLWPLLALANLFLTPNWSAHALGGLAIPLGILATRGLLRAGPRATVLALAGCLAPAGAYFSFLALAEVYHERAHQQAAVLTRDEADALRFLEQRRDGAGVLAPVYPGAAIPGWTGHPVWVGHYAWTPAFHERQRQTEQLMAGKLTATEARAFVLHTGARYILLPCGAAARVRFDLAPIVAATREFGCVGLLELGKQ